MRSSGSNLVKNYITFYECVFRGEDVKGVEMRKPGKNGVEYKGRDHVKYISIDGRIILRWMSRKWS